MAATPGFKGFGSTVKWNGTAIGYARDIPMPSMTRDDVDFSNQDSPDEFDETQAGFGHAGEVSFDIIFVPSHAGQAAAIADFLSGTTREMIITGPTSAAFTWTCNAWVKGINGQLPHKGEIVMNLALKLTGKPVLGVTYAGDLTGLTITTATLLPSLTASVYSYTATCTGTSVTVTPTMATATSIEVWASGALVSVLATGGTSSAIAISGVGTNVEIEIKVKRTAYATRSYAVTLVKTA
jgi:hypothetical protein